jgi:hypothetical protein
MRTRAQCPERIRAVNATYVSNVTGQAATRPPDRLSQAPEPGHRCHAACQLCRGNTHPPSIAAGGIPRNRLRKNRRNLFDK